MIILREIMICFFLQEWMKSVMYKSPKNQSVIFYYDTVVHFSLYCTISSAHFSLLEYLLNYTVSSVF